MFPYFSLGSWLEDNPLPQPVYCFFFSFLLQLPSLASALLIPKYVF